MSTRDTVRRASDAITDAIEHFDVAAASTALSIVATSLALIAGALVIGVIVYVTRH